jgi:hypothetical protein
MFRTFGEHPNYQWAYPNASWTQQQAIVAEFKQYALGLLHFFKVDPAVPAPLRAKIAALGLCKDECVARFLTTAWFCFGMLEDVIGARFRSGFLCFFLPRTLSEHGFVQVLFRGCYIGSHDYIECAAKMHAIKPFRITCPVTFLALPARSPLMLSIPSRC